MNIAESETFMREHYRERGARFCAEALGLSVRQIQRRAQSFGLRRKSSWTPADDRTLRLLWSELPLAEIAERMGRTMASLYQRAKVLQLPLGCPQGWEYLTHAAHRCGYEVAQMRRLLRWASVRLMRAQSRPGVKPRGAGLRDPRAKTWIVEPDRVDEAVARWLQCETVNAAAARLGVSAHTLERLLAGDPEAGQRPRKHVTWRVPSAVAEARVAQWREGRAA